MDLKYPFRDSESLSKASLQELDAYFETLVETKTELESQMRLVKHYRNTLAPPNRLPRELLAEIFKIYVTQVRSTLENRESHYRTPTSWIRFTHVCQRWREDALECKDIWSDLIFDSSAEFTRMMLQRSGNMLLNVVCPPTLSRLHAPRNDCFYEALGLTDRLKTVNITLGRYDGVPEVQKLTSSLAGIGNEARSLQKLSLVSAGVRGFVLPRGLLQNGIGCLTTLELVFVDFAWDHLRLPPTLKVMRIARTGERAKRMPSWDTMIRLLSQVPRLEVLNFDSVCPFGPHPSPSHPVALGRLKHVSVNESSPYLIGLFACILIPSSTAVDVHIFDEEHEVAGTPYDELASNLCAARIAGPQHQQGNVGIEEIQLLENEARDTQLELSFSRPEGYPAKTRGYDIYISFESTPLSGLILQGLITGFDNYGAIRSTLSNLHLYYVEPITSDMLANVFGTLPNLKTMTCFSDVFMEKEILDIVSRELPAPEGDTPPASDEVPKPCFPALEKLVFVDDGDRMLDGGDVDEIINALAKRPQGYRIRTIDFDTGTSLIPKKRVAKLMRGLPDVEVLLRGSPPKFAMKQFG